MNPFQPSSNSESLANLRLILAPMEGVVDAVMRDMLTRIGGYDRCVTEFVRVSQTVLPSRVFWRLCPELLTGGTTPAGTPVYVQLLGSDPHLMAKNAGVAVGLGAPGIDLNFGCPTKTVNNSDGGAALLKTPERIGAVCAAVREAVPEAIPVTAKIRLGFEDDGDFERITDTVFNSGVNELVVHARTRQQGYRPPAHWHRLAEVVRSAPIPVIANGELWSPTDILRCHEVSGCNAFMLARGALCRPDLARATRMAVLNQPYDALGWHGVLPMLTDFLKHNGQAYEPRHASNPLKQWLVYLKNYFPQAAALFAEVKRVRDFDTMLAVLETAGANPGSGNEGIADAA